MAARFGRQDAWYTKLIRTGLETLDGFWRLFKSLTLAQKIVVALVLLALNVITIVALVYSERIYEWLAPRTESMRESHITWVVLWLFTLFSAFPPMIGYSTCVTLSGFIYGMKGWYIASTANVVGSTLSFIVCRRYLSNWSQRLAARDTRIAAFTLVVQRDGFPLLVAIRLCPLPYAFSNCALSTIQSIRALPFALATAAATPKLLLHVFVGSRIALLAQNASKEDGQGMDAGSIAANYLGIAAGVIIGMVTGLVIYRRTVARARQLEAEARTGPDNDEEQRLGSARGAMYGGKARPRSVSTDDESGIPLASAGLEHPDAFADPGFRDDAAVAEEDAWMAGAEDRDEIDFVDHRARSDSGGSVAWATWDRRGSGDSESKIGLMLDKRRD